MDWRLYDRVLLDETVNKTKLTCHKKLIGEISKSFKRNVAILELHWQR